MTPTARPGATARPRPRLRRRVPRPLRPVDADQSFPALEEQILERWRERDVFAESLRRRRGAPQWVFYEGPPTANGRPGSHHVLARVFKDIYPRYKTMRGHHVERKGGWDCHGLPVEIAVEQQLGISSKEEIEAYGIAEFNARCRESVFRVPRRLEPAHRAHRLLARPRRRLPHAGHHLHRVGLVGAAPDLGQGAALRGPQGRPLLPALRHRAVLARAGAGLPRRRRPVGLRALPRDRGRGRRPGRRRAARVDDDAVDAGVQRCGRGRPRARLRSREGGRDRRSGDRRRGAARAGRRRGRAGDRPLPRRSAGRRPLRAAVRIHRRLRVRRARPQRAAGRLRDRRGRHRPRPHGDRVRRGRLPPGRGATGWPWSTPSAWTAPTTSASAATRDASSRTPTPT